MFVRLGEMKGLTKKAQWHRYYKNKLCFDKIRRGINFRFFEKELLDIINRFIPKKKLSLIEMGCGNSDWLPYLCSRYRCEVAGIDYLEDACHISRQKLSESSCSNYEIYCGDFAKLFDKIKKKFDFIVSFGVVEHFQTPGKILSIFSKYMIDNSLIVTVCPNTTGLSMALQKYIDREIYDGHYKFSLKEFIQYHKASGFEILYASYIGYMSFNNLDFSGHGKKGMILKALIKLMNWPVVYVAFLLKTMCGFRLQSKKLSGSMVVVAQKSRMRLYSKA